MPAGAIGVTLSARVGEEVGEGVAVGDAGPVVLGVGLESRVEGEGRGEGFEDGFVLEFHGQLEVDDRLPVDRVGEVVAQHRQVERR